MGEPKITIVTVVRNGAAFIERCLQSVAAQTHPHVEHIVLDGASTDGTQAIIERYRANISHYVSKPDKGAYDATMQGYALATGDVVGLLHADDWLSPDACETLAEMYRAKPDAEIFCFGVQEYIADAEGRLQKSRLFTDPAEEHFGLLDGLYCQGVNRYYARRLLAQHGHFDAQRYPQLGDREFYVRIGLHGLNKAWTDAPLYHFLVHEGSNSTGGEPAKIVRFLEETVQIAEDYLTRELTAGQRSLLCDWRCFNLIRMAYFQLKAGRVAACAKTLLQLLHSPCRMFKNLLCWRMPEAYRPRSSA